MANKRLCRLIEKIEGFQLYGVETLLITLVSAVLGLIAILFMVACIVVIGILMFGSLRLLGATGSMWLWGLVGLGSLIYGLLFSKDTAKLREWIKNRK